MTAADAAAARTAADAQVTLVSGTNIKTVNSTSLLGSGDIVVSASPAGSSGQVQYNNAGSFGGTAAVVYATSGTHVQVSAVAAGSVPLSLKGAASATGNLFQALTSASAVWARLFPNVGNGVSLYLSGYDAGGTGRGFTMRGDSSTGSAVFTTDITAGFLMDDVYIGSNVAGSTMNYAKAGMMVGRNVATAWTLTHGAYFSDVAARSVSLSAADAYTSAVTNTVGGAFSINGGSGGPSNSVGGAVTIKGGQGRGTGVGGVVLIQTAPAGSSGSSLNALVTQVTVASNGLVSYPTTVTAGGTTGNQTINKLTGTVNIAAAGTTVTVTNSLVSASSIVLCVIRTGDTTARIANVVPASGSFTINIVAATAEVSIGFLVVN
jgi:hypothetical protein